MSFSLRELQLLAEKEFSVEDSRQDLTDLTEYMCNLENQDNDLTVIIENERKLPLSIARQHKVFFVEDNLTVMDIPERYHTEALGFVKYNKLIYSGRLVYPVMDVKGRVMGFCGWDKFEKPKYLDSVNHGYKANDCTFYGMEKSYEYYNNNKPVFLVEGIVCCLYLRSKGYQAYASLGSHLTKYVIEIFKRFEDRLIVIPDNDLIGKPLRDMRIENAAGEGFVRQVKKWLPKALIYQSTVAKDIDDTRLAEDGKFEKDLLADLETICLNPYIPTKVLRRR